MVPWGVFNLFSSSLLFARPFRPRHLRFFHRLFNQTVFWMARLMATFVLGRHPKPLAVQKKVATLRSNFTSPSPSAYLSTASVPLMFTHQMTHTNTPHLPPSIHPSIARSLSLLLRRRLYGRQAWQFCQNHKWVCVFEGGSGKDMCFCVKDVERGVRVCSMWLKVLCEVTFDL